jgi:hypothetical protein
LDAINTPCVSFHIKNGIVHKGPLNLIDRDIKRIGKKCLNLPQRTSAKPLYLSYQRGGLNLLPINLVADISQSAHLGQLSMAFLKSLEKKRVRRPPEPRGLANYLCSSMEGAFANEYTDISNIWDLSSVRNAATWNQNQYVVGQWWWQNDPTSEWIHALEGSSWIRPPQLHPWTLSKNF